MMDAEMGGPNHFSNDIEGVEAGNVGGCRGHGVRNGLGVLLAYGYLHHIRRHCTCSSWAGRIASTHPRGRAYIGAPLVCRYIDD